MVSAYIFISAAQRDLLAPLGLPADRSFVKHNFVPPPPRALADVATAAQIAYVGRLDEAKGAPFLMRAWDGFRASATPVATAPGGRRRRRDGGGGDPLGEHASRP